MIRFGLRLAVAGGREAAARLIIIAAAVAIGVCLLLGTLAGMNGVNAQNQRYAWLNSGIARANTELSDGTPQPDNPAQPDSGAASTNGGGPGGQVDPLWWLVRGDYFHGQTIGRVDVAATGPRSPIPPGLPKLPRAGEYYASPALADLLRDTPEDQLADRFPGHLVGTIGDAALPAPDSLIVVIGHDPADLAGETDAKPITGIMTTSPADCNNCYIGIRADGMALILGVVATALLFPILMFIGTATRLSATRREQRFAAMRLIGATPRQITTLATVESTVSAVAGTAIGFALFYTARPAIAAFPFTGARFFPADLTLGWPTILAVAIGIPAAAATAARLSLRRVTISPLGVTRQVTQKPPRAYRLIPLIAGLAELAYLIDHRPVTSMGQLRGFLSGFLITMVGLVVAGPWLTMVVSRLMAQRTSRPATLIAARRLADNPRAGFRSVSGLVLALFVTTSAIGVISSIVSNRDAPTTGVQARTLFAYFAPVLAPHANPVPPGLTDVTGVTAVTLVRRSPIPTVTIVQRAPGTPTDPVPTPSSLALCADLARTPDFGRCADGAEVGWVFGDLIGFDGKPQVWPAAPFDAREFAALPIESMVIGTDGDLASVERARTFIEANRFLPRFPATEAEWNADTARVLNGWKRLATVVVLVSLVIAGCSLAVSVAGGVNDRKRPFSLLRLTGVPLRSLRDVVALESAAPLLVAAAVAIGTGFLAAHLFLVAQMHYSVRPPGTAYYLIVGIGLAASLVTIAATLPLLRRITGPETARNE
jgi:hypothetical protein